MQPSAPGSNRKLKKDAVPSVFDVPQHLQVYIAKSLFMYVDAVACNGTP